MATNARPFARAWMPAAVSGVECFRARSWTHSFPRHSHPGYAIGVIESGVGGLYHRGSTSFIPPQHLVMMNPEEAHTGFPAAAPQLTWRMLYVAEHVFADPEQLGVRPFFRDLCVGDPGWVRRVVALHTLLETSNDLFEQQSAWFATCVPLAACLGGAQPAMPRGREPRAVARVKEYLRTEHRRQVSLAEAARIAGVTAAYLIRCFRRTTGITPHAWLLQLRVESAKALIRRGTPLAQVAAVTGFADQSHLTRRFRAIVGVTPGTYAASGTPADHP